MDLIQLSEQWLAAKEDEKIATEIALDHLTEDGQYYQKLIAAGLAKEFQPQANSGFGDPNQSFNDKARLGSEISCTPGNNVVGKIGTTPIGQVKDSEPVGPSKVPGVELDIDEPSLDEDRCTDIAKRKYKKWPSAYASGAVVRCRQGKIWRKKNEEVESVEEGWDDMLKSVRDKNKPQPNGGSGIKRGSSYGGGKQKDTPEQDEDEPKKKVSEGKGPETDNVPFLPPYNTTSSPETKDKSGAVHTPMSRAKHLARLAMGRLKKDLGSKGK